MTRARTALCPLLIATLGFLATRTAAAASLQQVSNWGVSGLPSDVTMYIYVPDRVVTFTAPEDVSSLERSSDDCDKLNS